jgi:hypothetical protein
MALLLRKSAILRVRAHVDLAEIFIKVTYGVYYRASDLWFFSICFCLLVPQINTYQWNIFKMNISDGLSHYSTYYIWLSRKKNYNLSEFEPVLWIVLRIFLAISRDFAKITRFSKHIFK